MEKLKNELIEMVNVFDSCKISEENQREIIIDGVNFLFDDENHAKLDCFKFSKLLRFCKSFYPDFDVNKMLDDIRRGYADEEYETLVKFFLQLENQREIKEERIAFKTDMKPSKKILC